MGGWEGRGEEGLPSCSPLISPPFRPDEDEEEEERKRQKDKNGNTKDVASTIWQRHYCRLRLILWSGGGVGGWGGGVGGVVVSVN